MPTQKIKKIKNIILHEQSYKWLWTGLATLLMGGFLIISSEVRELIAGQSEWIGRLDQACLQYLISIRKPLLNIVAIDITALGSVTLLTVLIVSLVIYFLLSKNKRSGVVTHLITAGVGASVLSAALKSYFERSRPDLINRLVEVEGYSYPSGHSLGSAAIYFTLAVICSQALHGKVKRAFCVGLFLFLILCIGISRMYLGVHYFSDVTAGICVGIAWASLLTSALAFIKERRST
jgi:undecaprenyl-diphosphatase